MKKAFHVLAVMVLLMLPATAQAKVNYYTVDKGDTRPRSVTMIWREAYKANNQVTENVIKFVNVPEDKARQIIEKYSNTNPFRAELVYASVENQPARKYASMDICQEKEIRLGMYPDCQLGIILKKPSKDSPVIKDVYKLSNPIKKINGKYYVPLSSVVSAFGGYVVWNGQTQTVNVIKVLDDPERIGKMKYDFSIKIGSKQAVSKNKKIDLGSKVLKINNTTYIPLSAAAKLLDCKIIDWQKTYPEVSRIDLVKKEVAQQ